LTLLSKVDGTIAKLDIHKQLSFYRTFEALTLQFDWWLRGLWQIAMVPYDEGQRFRQVFEAEGFSSLYGQQNPDYYLVLHPYTQEMQRLFLPIQAFGSLEALRLRVWTSIFPPKSDARAIFGRQS
jgi:hypothetical protein